MQLQTLALLVVIMLNRLKDWQHVVVRLGMKRLVNYVLLVLLVNSKPPQAMLQVVSHALQINFRFLRLHLVHHAPRIPYPRLTLQDVNARLATNLMGQPVSPAHLVSSRPVREMEQVVLRALVITSPPLARPRAQYVVQILFQQERRATASLVISSTAMVHASNVHRIHSKIRQETAHVPAVASILPPTERYVSVH